MHILSPIEELEKDLGIPLFLVGGAVRDYVINRRPGEGFEINDYDFSTTANPDEIVKALRAAGNTKYSNIKLDGKAYGRIKFMFYGEHLETEIDITTMRVEEYAENSRKPRVRWTDKLDDDLRRRDFYINAIAMNSEGDIIDPFDGMEDIQNKNIHIIGGTHRYMDDPLRIMRAFRFAAQLNFNIDEEDLGFIRNYGTSNLSKLSVDKLMSEFDKLLMCGHVHNVLPLMHSLGILSYIITEFHLVSLHRTRVLAEQLLGSEEDVEMKWSKLIEGLYPNTSPAHINKIVANYQKLYNWSNERTTKVLLYTLNP